MSARYSDECPFCHRSGGVGETAEHLIMRCPRWSVQRAATLDGFFEGASWVNYLGGRSDGNGWDKEQVKELWVGVPTQGARDLQVTSFGDDGAAVVALPGCVRVATFLQLVLPLRQGEVARGLEPMRANAVNDGRAALFDESDSEMGDRGEDEVD